MTDPTITPPPELVQKWFDQAELATNRIHCIATRAAQWGADQELEACCEWLDREGWSGESRQLRAARRPNPPSLKNQARKLLECYGTSGVKLTADQCNTILRALEDSNG